MNRPNQVQAFNEYNRVVFTTEEYAQFIKAVKQENGEVTNSFTMTNGQGLSVQYRLPAINK
ncbi:hypothetical protein [Aquibacillus saliphilus]|uniref:hypothetical protein n=1 Tax=Aquibacillus saliphilus TaxID=1909422 RepID=UPI001CF04B62|nr:hypothetical protein [Aquibacillus saliphilus]